MKRFAIAGLVGVLLLTGCSAGGGRPTDGGGNSAVKAYHVPLDDGTSVVCVVYSATYRGGLSCDWDGIEKLED